MPAEQSWHGLWHGAGISCWILILDLGYMIRSDQTRIDETLAGQHCAARRYAEKS